jgi:sulfatase modifying factor 1
LAEATTGQAVASARELLAAAARELPKNDWHAPVRIWASIGGAYERIGDATEAARAFASAKASADELPGLGFPDVELENQVGDYADIAEAQISAGYLKDAAATISDAKVALSKVDGFPGAAAVLLATAQADAGDFNGAAMTASRLEKMPMMMQSAESAIAEAKAEAGDGKGAASHFSGAKETAEPISSGSVQDPAEKEVGRAVVQAMKGDIDLALSTAGAITDPYWQQKAYMKVAKAQALRGDVPGAIITIRKTTSEQGAICQKLVELAVDLQPKVTLVVPPQAAATVAVAPEVLESAKNFTNGLGMKLVRIGPGEFLMGSPADEEGRFHNETQHKVKLTKPFFLGAHHVTRGQFAAFVKDAAYRTDAEKDGWAYCLSANGASAEKVKGASWQRPGFDQTDDHPVVQVSWNDAQAFCQWLSKKEGSKYRLPTEAEWEYTCRAGTHAAYFWGDNPDGGQGFANCADLTLKDKLPNYTTFNWRDGFVFTSPVGSFRPNPWGLYDMIGNAWEWCGDYYVAYGDGDAVDPTGPAQGDISSTRVLRGGSWICAPRDCRAACRFWGAPGSQVINAGFRVCRDF